MSDLGSLEHFILHMIQSPTLIVLSNSINKLSLLCPDSNFCGKAIDL